MTGAKDSKTWAALDFPITRRIVLLNTGRARENHFNARFILLKNWHLARRQFDFTNYSRESGLVSRASVRVSARRFCCPPKTSKYEQTRVANPTRRASGLVIEGTAIWFTGNIHELQQSQQDDPTTGGDEENEKLSGEQSVLLSA